MSWRLLTKLANTVATRPSRLILAQETPRQLVGLQDVLCLVVDQATSLADFVFSSWLGSPERSAKLTLANLPLVFDQ